MGRVQLQLEILLGAGVALAVVLEVMTVCEGLPTPRAGERPLLGVNSLVFLQVTSSSEDLVTVSTIECFS